MSTNNQNKSFKTLKNSPHTLEKTFYLHLQHVPNELQSLVFYIFFTVNA